MGRYLDPDEVKAEVLASLPADCAELFHELDTDVTALHLNWQDYRSLYGTSPERIELLNWAAHSFFGLLDQTMRHDILLRIARLTDLPSIGGHTNSSLPQLVVRLRPHLQPAESADLQAKLDDLLAYCAPVRDLRNRLLAHDDLATALHYHSDPLPGTSRAHIEGALERIRTLLNQVNLLYQRSITYYQKVIAAGTGEDLIVALERARKHEVCERTEFDRKYGLPRADQAS
jgi:hypothetical protein